MIAVKQAMLLLLLAAVGTNACPGPEDCDGLNFTLPKTDLHKIFGDWVLVWAVADHQIGWDLLSNMTSSHVEFRLLPDNNTVTFNERNMISHKKCVNFFFNMTISSDAESHRLHDFVGTMEEDGVFSPYNKPGNETFFVSCPDCLVMHCRSSQGQFLLILRREGHHRDVEQLKAAHSDHHKLAECLGFPHDKPFIYDGAADFCHKKSSPEVKAEPTVKAEHS